MTHFGLCFEAMKKPFKFQVVFTFILFTLVVQYTIFYYLYNFQCLEHLF